MPESKGMIYRAFEAIKDFCTPRKLEPYESSAFQLHKDITENHWGYRLGKQRRCNSCRESDGFLSIKDPEYYLRGAGDYVPNEPDNGMERV